MESSAESPIVPAAGVGGEDFGRRPLVGPAPTLSPFRELWTVTRAELGRTVRSGTAPGCVHFVRRRCFRSCPCRARMSLTVLRAGHTRDG